MATPFRSGPAQRPQPPRAAPPGKVHPTVGPTSGVLCPWGCGHKNDFRPLAGAELGGMGEGSIGLEIGAVLSCDKCKQRFRITRLEMVPVIGLEPFQPKPRR